MASEVDGDFCEAGEEAKLEIDSERSISEVAVSSSISSDTVDPLAKERFEKKRLCHVDLLKNVEKIIKKQRDDFSSNFLI